MKQFLSICLIFGGISMLAAGCSEPKTSNMMENADDQAFKDYEAAVAAENQAMDADPGDVDE